VKPLSAPRLQTFPNSTVKVFREFRYSDYQMSLNLMTGNIARSVTTRVWKKGDRAFTIMTDFY
jgi:hypothetical protein